MQDQVSPPRYIDIGRVIPGKGDRVLTLVEQHKGEPSFWREPAEFHQLVFCHIHGASGGSRMSDHHPSISLFHVSRTLDGAQHDLVMGVQAWRTYGWWFHPFPWNRLVGRTANTPIMQHGCAQGKTGEQEHYESTGHVLPRWAKDLRIFPSGGLGDRGFTDGAVPTQSSRSSIGYLPSPTRTWPHSRRGRSLRARRQSWQCCRSRSVTKTCSHAFP